MLRDGAFEDDVVSMRIEKIEEFGWRSALVIRARPKSNPDQVSAHCLFRFVFVFLVFSFFSLFVFVVFFFLVHLQHLLFLLFFCCVGKWFTFVSLHLKWGHHECGIRLLEAVSSKIFDDDVVVLGGDFNTTPDRMDAIDSILKSIHCLNRLSIPPNTPTALMDDMSFDSSHQIDYLYCSPQLSLVSEFCEVGQLPKDGQGPYGVDSDGSDHAWILAVLKI